MKEIQVRETLNYTPLPNEQWKRVIFEHLPPHAQERVHVEISNCGRMRTFSQVSKGNLIHGTVTRTRLTTVQLSFLEERSPEGHARFVRMREELKTFRHDLKRRKLELEDKYKNGIPIKKREEDNLKKDQETYEDMKNMFKKHIKAEEETRKVRYGGYFHRLVAEYFVPRPSDDHYIVIHLDHDNQNNHFENLKWVTHDESIAHNNQNPNIIRTREERGIIKINKSYKLNESKVLLIKKALLRGRGTAEIARQFGVSSGQIRHIRRGGSWAEVKLEDEGLVD
jgi:hypothetical protein